MSHTRMEGLHIEDTSRIIIPIGSEAQRYRINGVAYHVSSLYEKKYDPTRKNSFRERMQRCLIFDKNFLTKSNANDIMPPGTVYSAAEKEVTA